jgi:hypothetical protein
MKKKYTWFQVPLQRSKKVGLGVLGDRDKIAEGQHVTDNAILPKCSSEITMTQRMKTIDDL